jgi:hypoxanthine phosphoribosyltransferase
MHIKDKIFEPYISEEVIQREIARVAAEINKDYQQLNPLFVSVLNGAFMFTSDLLKNISIPCELTFVRVKSYDGTRSTGQLSTLLGFGHPIRNRHIILLEDIVDSGLTIQHLKTLLQTEKPASVAVATLLLKPDALSIPLEVAYTGIEIPNQFVVGYGLDYDEQGRNLRDLYQLKM